VPAPANDVIIRAPAKINLALRVGPRRPDGFHDIRTVFHAVSLYDRLTARPAARLTLRLTGPESSGLPADCANIVWQAAEALAAAAGRRAEAEITVEKNIPVAAGLAGGSADAAAALVALNALWRLGLDSAALDRCAAELGSDVTFCLHGGSALGSGRGERLQSLPAAFAGLNWVLAAAAGSLSTPAVYRRFDEFGAAVRLPRGPDTQPVVDALARGDLQALADAIANDLQDAALELAPYLHQTLRVGRALGALAGFVSGSGPTCVFLARDEADAQRLAASLAESLVCRSSRAVTGPVRGALPAPPAGAPGTGSAS